MFKRYRRKNYEKQLYGNCDPRIEEILRFDLQPRKALYHTYQLEHFETRRGEQERLEIQPSQKESTQHLIRKEIFFRVENRTCERKH